MKALLPLLSLCLIALSTSAPPPFQPVNKFNAKELVGVDWYELFYANNLGGEQYGCPREVYTPVGSGKIMLQLGQYLPGLDGDFDSFLLVLQQEGNTGTFKILDNPDITTYYILDSDHKNCDWIIFGVDFVAEDADVIVVISKTPENCTALKRALDLAKKYGLASHHLQLQTCKCDYDHIFWKLKKERKNYFKSEKKVQKA